MTNNEAKKYNPMAKSDYGIPRFSFKSALALIIGGTISTILVPYLLTFIGVDFGTGVIIGNTFILGFVLAYSRFFIETKQGFCKKFWFTYIGFGLAFGFISFFWMYLNTYI